MTDPVLQAALRGEYIHIFGALQIDFPDYTLRLLDGSAELMIGGHMFVGADPVFGTIDFLEVPEEAIDDEAPEISIGLLPPDAAAAATLASGLMQGSTVRLMMGAYDPETNTVIGVPEQLFLGEIDVPTHETAKGRRSISFTVVSVFERLFEVREGERASDGWHQSIWPGELGLQHMTATIKNLYLGAKRPVPQAIGGGASFFGNPIPWEFAQ